MRNTLLAGIVALIALSVLVPATAGTAIAQSENSTTSSSEAEVIDQDTRLISAEYDEEGGEAVITLESDSLQGITISDAGAFVSGGEVRQRSITVDPGETTTIRMPVTKVNGYTGVSIATRQALYAVPIRTSANVFSGEATWDTVQTGAVGGASGVIILTGVIAWRMRSGGRKRRERVS